MKIYTKVGDKGNTSLYDGSKVSKDNVIINCIGDLDELNSELGCILASLGDKSEFKGDMEFLNIIINTQSHLFNLGSLIAHPNNPEKKNITFDADGLLVKDLENGIDGMTSLLPKLSNFILPGGNITMAFTHKARTICRRVERRMVAIKIITNNIENTSLAYINRLSDFLFTFARYIGLVYKIDEIIYRSKK